MSKSIFLAVLLALLVACQPADAPPATPAGLKATPADKSVKLEWTANTEADLKGYVLSTTLPDGALVSNTNIAAPATQATISDLTNGTVYAFKILAEDKAGNRSPLSAAITATPAAGTGPAKPSGFSASAQDSQVLLSWTKNPEADLKGYTLYYSADANNLNQTKALDTAATSTIVGSLINGTPYFFALEAENNAGQKSPRTDVIAATPQGALLVPIIATVSITGYGTSTQVRQGAGGIEVILTGQRLDTLTSAKLLGAFDFTIVQKSEASVKLTGIVPHGIEIGPRTLLVSGPSGEATMLDAIEITKITAAKTPQLNPSDTTGLGTPNRPYLTLTKALSVAASGDTILLGAGTYSTGESWPQSSTSNLTLPSSPNIKSGLTLEGQSSDKGAVVLQGGGRNAPSSGLVFAGNATVRNLSLRDFRFAMVINAGTASSRVGELDLDNFAAFDSLVGLTANFAQRISISKANFNNNNNGGLEAKAVRQLNISQSDFSGNTFGIAAGNDSVGGTLLSSSITLNQVTANQNTQFGLSLGSISIDLSNTTAKLNATYGLRILGKPSFVALRSGTSFEQNGDFQLFDARDASQGSFNATRFLLPGSNVVVGAVVGPTESGKFYKISNAGNSILFQ